MHDHPIDPPAPPSVDALIAGTLCLMTAWVEPCPHCTVDPQEQRALVADKLVMHLYILSLHPDVSPPLQEVMAQAHRRWVRMVRTPFAAPPASAQTSAAALAVH